MDPITSDLIGQPDSATLGADIAPTGGQDMWGCDVIAGAYPDQGRAASPATFTGGTGGAGLGGMAEGLAPGGTGPDGTLYERRGF